MSLQKLWVALIAVTAIAIGGYFYPNLQHGVRFGALTDTSYFDFFNAATGGGFQINGATKLSATTFVPPGTSTSVAGLQFGTCTINAYATTIAASTTAQVDCSGGASAPSAISGITSGDKVFVTLASTTVTTSEGLHLVWAAASTTNGYITMKIANDSGGTFTWASTASSSVYYLVIR